MDLSLEDQIANAIINKFFEPSWSIVTQPVYNPQTGQAHQELTPMQVPAPMEIVAQAIYNRAKADIIEGVLARINIDEMIEKWGPLIAKDVVNTLQEKDGRHWSPHPTPTERKKMLDKVYEAVAEEFGRQCVEHIKNTGGLMAVLEAGE